MQNYCTELHCVVFFARAASCRSRYNLAAGVSGLALMNAQASSGNLFRWLAGEWNGHVCPQSPEQLTTGAPLEQVPLGCTHEKPLSPWYLAAG